MVSVGTTKKPVLYTQVAVTPLVLFTVPVWLKVVLVTAVVVSVV